jgi:hypothetical protein
MTRPGKGEKAMYRISKWAPALLVLATAQGRNAAAQFYVIGPGSTIGGDILRGDGVSAFGWGWYNYLTPLGRAVDADTSLRLNAAAARSYAEQVVYRGARLEHREARVRDAIGSRYRRYLEAPSDADVVRGDALNALAHRLTGPGSSPSALRRTAVSLPAGAAASAPLSLPRAGVMIAPARLKADGPWPAPLNGPDFAPGRLAYHEAVGASLRGAAAGAVPTESVAAVDRALGNLRRGLEVQEGAPSAETNRARAFLGRLDRAARALHDPDAAAALGAVEGGSVTTVGGLLELMRYHHLQFGPAETPAEGALYRELHAALARQRAAVMAVRDPGRTGLPAGQRGNGREAAIGRNRTCQKRALPHREGPHRLLVLGCDVGQGQIAIDGQVLLLGMAAEQLQLGADDALLG